MQNHGSSGSYRMQNQESFGMQNNGNSAGSVGMQNLGSSSSYGMQNHGVSGMHNFGSSDSYGMQNHGSSGSVRVHNQGSSSIGISNMNY